MSFHAFLSIQAVGMAIAAGLIWTGDHKPEGPDQILIAAILLVLWPIPLAAFAIGLVDAVREMLDARRGR